MKYSGPVDGYETIPTVDCDDSGFELFRLLVATDSSASPVLKSVCTFVDGVGALFLVDPAEKHPLPPRLGNREMVDEARQIDLDQLPGADGEKARETMNDKGYVLLQWPDGTSVALAAPANNQWDSVSLLMAYIAARNNRELCLTGARATKGGVS